MSVPTVALADSTIAVVPAAVSRARYSVFQATPQRTAPLTQPRPQMRSVLKQDVAHDVPTLVDLICKPLN